MGVVYRCTIIDHVHPTSGLAAGKLLLKFRYEEGPLKGKELTFLPPEGAPEEWKRIGATCHMGLLAS